jgi:hypothetical protein
VSSENIRGTRNFTDAINISSHTPLVAAVEALSAEIVSSAASYTVTCKFQGTDNPSVSWTVAGSVVSDSDDGISIKTGTLNSGTNER